jgi:vancomycin resistance protein YoaR
MKKVALKFSGLIIALFLAGSLKAQAATADSADFSFILGDQSFPVSKELLSTWQGRENLYTNNIIKPQPQTVKSSLLESLGQTQPQPQTFKTYDYKITSVYNYINNLAKNLDKEKIEPSLEIKDGKVTNFVAPQKGIETDVYKSTMDTLNALQIGNLSVNLIAYETVPEKNLADTNNLGIKELVSEGVSGFKGSPHNRRVNITVGLEKYKGLIIPQGATFSFDDNLGPVTEEAGFLPELVIKGDLGTIPELGGGLCQVSTTTFRAAMKAGLPITARRNHAYAVQYYSPQGTDATIYPGSADLKFINDTPGAIMIWPYEKDANTLVFDFYGTKDTRKVTLETPVVYDRTPDGAMKATWTRIVTSTTGVTRTDIFKSNYQPPALFHKTHEYIPATTFPGLVKTTPPAT